jgi:hypothetical protein
MISRKRELEKAIAAALQNWAGDGMPAATVYTSRQKRDNGGSQIIVSCNSQEPLEGIDEYVTRVQVSGAIICTALVDDGLPSAIEELEILAENFVEMQTTDLLTKINAETETITVTDFQPDQSEDGHDGDLQRYIARYSFTAFVITTPDPEPEEGE